MMYNVAKPKEVIRYSTSILHLFKMHQKCFIMQAFSQSSSILGKQMRLKIGLGSFIFHWMSKKAL